ncbi:MAG: zinc-ribbon domain-containing protein [Candidatus Norongarragalinales archaeon]
MKYCPNCGKKLAQAASNYCPRCGGALREHVEKTKSTQLPAKPSLSLKERVARVVLAFALITAFILIGFYLPGVHWRRVYAVGDRYYEQLMIFNNDLSELNELANGYAGLPLDNSTLSRKAAFASAYALKARQALTSWNYFAAFLTQNEGILADYNVKASEAKSKIAAQQSTVKRQAQTMRSELSEFVGGGSGDAALASVLKALEEVDSKNT